MKIGTKIFPDECPECGEVKVWIKKPNSRIMSEGGKTFSSFTIICLKCKYETEVVKIREDYLREKTTEIEDVTPYKPNIFNKIVSNIFSFFIKNKIFTYKSNRIF
jgi:hypothetical protein